jgi:hypothetical protein
MNEIVVGRKTSNKNYEKRGGLTTDFTDRNGWGEIGGAGFWHH